MACSCQCAALLLSSAAAAAAAGAERACSTRTHTVVYDRRRASIDRRRRIQSPISPLAPNTQERFLYLLAGLDLIFNPIWVPPNGSRSKIKGFFWRRKPGGVGSDRG